MLASKERRKWFSSKNHDLFMGCISSFKTFIHEFSLINKQNQHGKKQEAFLFLKVKTLLLKTNLFPYNIASYLLKNPFMPFLKKIVRNLGITFSPQTYFLLFQQKKIQSCILAFEWHVLGFWSKKPKCLFVKNTFKFVSQRFHFKFWIYISTIIRICSLVSKTKKERWFHEKCFTIKFSLIEFIKFLERIVMMMQTCMPYDGY